MAAPQQASIADSTRRLAAALLATGRIRLELLALEAHEAKGRAVAVVFWAVLAAIAVGFGLVFAALAATVALWDEHRLLVLGLATAGFAVLAAFGFWRIAQLMAGGPSLFRASLAELADDEAALRGGPPP